MYASAHWDLVRETQAERLRGTAAAIPTDQPTVTPGRLTTWGPRASVRGRQPAVPTATETPVPPTGEDRVVRLPVPRDGWELDPARAVLLLDA